MPCSLLVQINIPSVLLGLDKLTDYLSNCHHHSLCLRRSRNCRWGRESLHMVRVHSHREKEIPFLLFFPICMSRELVRYFKSHCIYVDNPGAWIRLMEWCALILISATRVRQRVYTRVLYSYYTCLLVFCCALVFRQVRSIVEHRYLPIILTCIRPL